MSATQYPFDQIAHFRRLLEQKGVSPERLQEHYALGAISDVLEIPNPKEVTPEMRDAARSAYGLPPLNPPLLEPVGTITIPALLGRFSAREKLVLNYGSTAKPGARIVYIDAELLDVREEPVAETTLSYAQLTHSALDGPILAALGNRPGLAIHLRQIYWLIGEQPNGEPGTLLNNGRANIFYLPGLVRVVGVHWLAGGGGWYVRACSVTYPDRWYDGRRVFSRNSSVAVAV